MKIAVIDKAPSKANYSKYFDFEFDLFHMSSTPLAGKLLKKDVDLEFDHSEYDLVILIGSEAAKEYAKVTSVVNFQGQLVDGKYVCLTNPAMLVFKPEGKQDFDRALSRIKGYIENGPSAVVSGDYKGIANREEALEYLKEVLNDPCKYVSLDTETTALYPRKGYVLGLCISYQPKRGRYILSDCLDDELLGLVQQIVDTKEIVFHNLKFDYKMIEYHFGIQFRKDKVHDTMLLHYVLDENNSHGLKQLALKYTDYGDYDSELKEFIDTYCKKHAILREEFVWDSIPFDIISKYASIDPTVTLVLFDKFWPIVSANEKFLWVYKNLLIRGTIFLHEIEEAGIPFSKERLKAAENYLQTEIEQAKKELYSFEELKKFEEFEGIIFNPNSVIQLRKLLFDYVGLDPTGKKTATGADSLDADVLEELAKEHPLPGALLKIRKRTKILNTYVTKLLPELDRDGRIRTNFNLVFTTSGRLSSSGVFNAQQIVRDDPIVKGCIVAPPGYKIVSQDLSTAEMYYAAVLSGDKNLQEVFKTVGGDFHSSIAKMVFDLHCDVKDVKKLFPALRQSAKAISFGILYGSGPRKVADTVSEATKEYYSIDKAKDDINTYFSKFPKLKKWLKSREDFIRANGFTYSFFGRKRRLINVFSEDKGIAAGEVRSGINSEIQSIASDINLLAAMDAHDEIKRRKLDAKIFMLVHDSIVAVVREDCVEEYKQLLAWCTKKDRGCSIPGAPIGIDQEVGDDYSFGHFNEVYKLEGNSLSRVSTG